MATTLVTFLYDCPVPARTIELLGSWDNFDKSYHLKQDLRRGSSIWTGCFSFEEIICDGNPSELSPKRNGALKIGGTYWYYYKINQDEEHYNPSVPSTTFCPLLPGQRLNILEVPMESRSRSSSRSSDGFTRNPADRYITPIPPKPSVSPSVGDICRQPYSPPLQPFPAPHSAPYPRSVPSVSPGDERQSKSATTSPRLSPTPVYYDFRSLRERATSPKPHMSNSQEQSPPRNVRELQIGSPVLISTTAEEMNLVPLRSARNLQTSSSLSDSIATRLREFSPLGSHPVDLKDLDLVSPGTISDASRRPHSHTQSKATPTMKRPGRIRANSAGTRRTKHYPASAAAPLAIPTKSRTELQRPSLLLETSSATSTRPKTPLNKDLPALPRYLVPAPLFACNKTSTLAAPISQQEEPTPAVVPQEKEDSPTPYTLREQKSHFSTWSSTSLSPTSSQDEPAISPISISSSTNSSPTSSPKWGSDTFATAIAADDNNDNPQDKDTTDLGWTIANDATSAPILRIPTPTFFSPEIFDWTLHHPIASPNRHAACFGYAAGAPAKEVGLEEACADPVMEMEREVQRLEKLVGEFKGLGGAVR